MAALDYGYTKIEVENMAFNYAVYLGKRDETHLFSGKWFSSFIKRWPELNVIKHRSLSNYKSQGHIRVSCY